MTKAEQARITAWRLRILQHADGEPRQVAGTCRYVGISRTVFYRWKKRFDELREAATAGAYSYTAEDGGMGNEILSESIIRAAELRVTPAPTWSRSQSIRKCGTGCPSEI